MGRGDSNKICNFHVKKLMKIGLACCACKKAHDTCDTSRRATFMTGRRIKSYVNDLILDNPYDIVFGANIPLEDDIKYQLCNSAYRNFLLKHEEKKEKEKEKETSGIEEDNNPCRRSARLAATLNRNLFITE